MYRIDLQYDHLKKVTANSVGFEPYFYALGERAATEDEMSFEKTTGQFETRWDKTLNGIVTAGRIVDDNEFGDLMVFIAHSALRLPYYRRTIDERTDGRAKAEFKRLLSTSSGRLQFRTTLEKLGYTLLDDEFNGLVEHALSSNYYVRLEREYDAPSHVQDIITDITPLAGLLSIYSWELIRVAVGTPDLICSDVPIKVYSEDTTKVLTGIEDLEPNLSIQFPIDRRLLLVGNLDKPAFHPAGQLDTEQVALVNRRTKLAARSLCLPSNQYVYIDDDGTVVTQRYEL
jgi:hypothetical protein